MVTKEGFAKIVNFITSGPEAIVLERGHISHIAKMHYLFYTFFDTPDERTDNLDIKLCLLRKGLPNL